MRFTDVWGTKKFVALIFLLVLIGASLLMFGIGGLVTRAEASVATANTIAQDYQLQQCKDIGGLAWHCYNSRTPAQGCSDLGNTYYNCNGTFTQQYIVGGLRECALYVNVQKGTGAIIYHYDTCLH